MELISFRGLMKSFEDIQNGNFMKTKNQRDVDDTDDNSKYFKPKSKMLTSIKNTFIFSVVTTVNLIEGILYFLMSTYDNYVYSPLQTVLTPLVRLVPRYIRVSNSTCIPVFTANIVTLSRTFLIFPIAWFLKYDFNQAAFWCVVLHDFLDHLDGIVAKIQRVTYPNHDDPILGGFLDAFCDKIVNVVSLLTIIQTVTLEKSTNSEIILFLFLCYSVIAYETVIGIIRVQDFFLATFKRDYNIKEKAKPVDQAKVTAASMEGKLKEKLESMGIAFLCLGISKLNLNNQLSNKWIISGLVCLLLTLRMAHKSLVLKLKARQSKRVSVENLPKSTSSNDLWLTMQTDLKSKENELTFIDAKMRVVDYEDNEIKDQGESYSYQKFKNLVPMDEQAEPSMPYEIDSRVDKVYTVGCFDLFHHGHIKLIERMRKLGKTVIVGVHDSRSIYKLKNRVPVDSTALRMLNVKKYADVVFCISGTDPSAFMTCIVNLKETQTSLYVRGDDMLDFPSKQTVENLMPIKYLPYTSGVSSTQIRKENYSHILSDDKAYLEQNS